MIRTDLRGAIDTIADFTGIHFSDTFQKRLERQLESHQNYRPDHRNLSLADFGLRREKVFNDLEGVFNKYGFSK
jgi:hypothetical protein